MTTKGARLWLLLFLAVLLPVRGAVAAAMWCSMTPVPAPQHETVMHGEGHEHHHAEGAASPSAEKCNLCAASCCLTPLPSQPPSVAAPLPGPAAVCPEIDAPPVSFLSDGQERPPRSI
jgi:hypothetical protein